MKYVCVNFGDKYNNAYVDALYYMVYKYNKIDHFICITDRHRNINKNIQQYMIPESEYEGVWNKLQLFNTNLPLPKKFLYIDLDIIIQSKLKFENRIKTDSVLFIDAHWGNNHEKEIKIGQPTNLNSSFIYINRECKIYKKILKGVELDDWCKFKTTDRFFYNVVGKENLKFFDNIKFYSYLGQSGKRMKNSRRDVCLLDGTGGTFISSLDKNHWLFNYYPVHLSYPSTYHIDQ